MAIEYSTLARECKTEIIVKKSKFITSVSPVNSERDAVAFVERIRKQYWDATHNVYGFVVGENDEVARFSDDGEPSGTAGKPVFEAIKVEKVKYSVVVVTRYFGGILLGASGLIRAYGQAAHEGIREAGIVTMRLYTKVSFAIDYNNVNKVQRYLESCGHSDAQFSYQDRVFVDVDVMSTEVEKFCAEMTELLLGNFSPTYGEEKYMAR